jgi:hypothetical protein
MQEMITPPQESTINSLSVETDKSSASVVGTMDGISTRIAKVDKEGISIAAGIELHNLDQESIAHAISMAQEKVESNVNNNTPQ